MTPRKIEDPSLQESAFAAEASVLPQVDGGNEGLSVLDGHGGIGKTC